MASQLSPTTPLGRCQDRPLVTTQRRDLAARRRKAFANPLLWTLQGWLAMFYIAAAYAKLTEPRENLIFLMEWPAFVAPSVVWVVGWMELGLAIGVLAPLVSWRFGRPILLLSAAMLGVNALVMAIFYATGLNALMTVVNILLVAVSIAILAGRRRAAS